MNRSIKFRGKSPYNNWVIGSLVMAGDDTFIIPEYVENEQEAHEEIQLVDPQTVGQYWQISKGLHLYGGDLFKAECAPSGKPNNQKTRICRVTDSDSGPNMSVWHNNEWWAYSKMDYTTAKKIGNIHDNPDLLT